MNNDEFIRLGEAAKKIVAAIARTWFKEEEQKKETICDIIDDERDGMSYTVKRG